MRILERLGSSPESWQARLEKLRGGRLLGRFFAASRERLREVATRLAVDHLANSADARCDKKHLKSGICSRARGRFEQAIHTPYLPTIQPVPPLIFRSVRAPRSAGCISDVAWPSRWVRLANECDRLRDTSAMHVLASRQ